MRGTGTTRGSLSAIPTTETPFFSNIAPDFRTTGFGNDFIFDVGAADHQAALATAAQRNRSLVRGYDVTRGHLIPMLASSEFPAL